MSTNSYPNASIAGAGSIGSGTYNKIDICGSGKANGDIICADFDASGSAKVDGNLTCSGTVDVSGAFKVEGNLSCGSLDGSGAVKITGGVVAKEVDVSGSFDVGGDCEAEEVDIRGTVEIEGLLNAETIDLSLESIGGNCKVGQIGGGSITIKPRSGAGGKFLFFFAKNGHADSHLETTLIEADRVELENVIADTVRTIDAVIGDECEIGTLEYRGEIEISENAKIGNIVKI